jgi:hypothetical protein
LLQANLKEFFLKLIVVEFGDFYLEVFAKTFAKVSHFRHKYFAKTKSVFREKNERENIRANPSTALAPQTHAGSPK